MSTDLDMVLDRIRELELLYVAAHRKWMDRPYLIDSVEAQALCDRASSLRRQLADEYVAYLTLTGKPYKGEAHA